MGWAAAWSSTATPGDADLGRRSEPGWRDRAAAEVCLSVAGDLLPEGTVLLHDDSGEGVAVGLVELGLPVVRWRRFDGPGQLGTPLPPIDERCAAALIRLPRSWPAFEFALAACLPQLAPGAPVLVYGAKDEGIQSAPRRMEGLLEGVQTVANARRCRVIQGHVPVGPGGGGNAGGGPISLSSYAEERPLDLGWGELSWVSYPGTFARGGLDGGTRALLSHLPPIPAGTRILDFAAGTGVVARAVAHVSPEARVQVLEPDALARQALAANMGWSLAEAEAGVVPSDSWDRGDPYDLIVSNPPYHVGKDESLDVIETLIRRAGSAMAPGGELRMVVQRRLPVEDLLTECFRTVSVVADEGPYRVWSAAGARSGPAKP